jgi:phosphatidylserine decarboxylase
MVMLGLFNLIIGEAPAFQLNDGLVGFPINAILDWPMGTTAGVATFFIPKVNAQFKKMFDVWASYLKSSDSCAVLSATDGGWFSPAALETMPDFQKTFVCDPSRPHWGFTSWDNFFTRLFQPNVRPVYFSDDNSIVNSGCESTVYRIQYNIQERDRFWLKGQPYSLAFMLNNHHFTSKFVNGTVYQAFLSALEYHRWHSPVNGTIKDVVSVPGAYYVESPAEGFRNPSGPDPAADDLSQSFITSVATRALIFIEADNPEIGLMCFMAVGMAEVSTCEITVKPNNVVKKGDPLGMFHYGGSTHCLIFRQETKITFTPDVGDPVQLNTAIGTVGR